MATAVHSREQSRFETGVAVGGEPGAVSPHPGTPAGERALEILSFLNDLFDELALETAGDGWNEPTSEAGRVADRVAWGAR